MASDRHSGLVKLGESNYSSWAEDMCAYLMTKEVWSLVKGEDVQPPPSESKELKAWRINHDIAVEEIFLSLESSQRVHVKGIMEDPVEMWKKLKSVHLQKHLITHFNAYDELFNIRLQENESLSSLMT